MIENKLYMLHLQHSAAELWTLIGQKVFSLTHVYHTVYINMIVK